MPDLPRISIVTPSYNQRSYLEGTIRSILDQGYPNLEYIIIDGGSSDGSVDLIKKYAPHLTYWVSEPDRGQSQAINKGLARASGDLLTWLNSDDYYMPSALHRFAEAALAHSKADVFVGGGRRVDEAGRLIDYREPFAEVTLESLYQWGTEFFQQPSTVFRRTAWAKAGPLDQTLHIALDLDLWLKMWKAGCRFHGISAPLSTAICHGAAKTTAYPYLTLVEAAIVVIRHGGEHVARRRLERLAQTLSAAELDLERIRSHPLVRVLRPIRQLLRGSPVRRDGQTPSWARADLEDGKRPPGLVSSVLDPDRAD